MMISNYGLCTLPVIPIRATASHRSEMVSQLLFGEAYYVLHATSEWVEIENLTDHYHGFIAVNQHENFSANTYNIIEKSPIYLTQTVLHIYDEKRYCRFTLAPSSTLRLSTDKDIQMGDFHFKLEENLKATSIHEILRTYEGAPYLWGGRTPWGIDCSGFTQAVYKTQGIALPRDASQQAKQGETVNLSEAGFGDLAFFQNEKGNITHVGMLLSNTRILHCSGRVRNDRIDTQGIFCESSKIYSHNLHSIKHITTLNTK